MPENTAEQSVDWMDELMGFAPQLLGALLTLIIGFWLAKLIGKIVARVAEKRGVEPTLIPFLKSLVVIIIKVAVLISAAAKFGLETTSFVALLGALGLAIGMALQGNLSHLASGVMILIFKPFKVGHFIVTNGYSGTVNKIELFNTILTTLDNRIIIMPNGSITGSALENLSVNDQRKVPMTFGIGYADDIDKAKEVIAAVCKAIPEIVQEKPVDIFVSELADSSVNFAVRPWVKKEDYWTVYAKLNEQIKKEFDANSVSIPFPQMDVHMQKDA